MASLREQNAYKAFTKAAVGKLNCSRVENSVGDGMSDLIVQSHAGFEIWLEVKAIEKYPARDSTHWIRSEFRPGQLPFLRERISWGGHGFVLLRVAALWWLLDPTENTEALSNRDHRPVITKGSVDDIIEYLENLKYEDCPYGSPNYRPGTIRRKAQLCVSDGAGNG